jgi:hypothetical protein
MVCLPVLSVLTMGSPHKKAAPIRFFKIVWGMPACTEDPKNEVRDCRHLNMQHHSKSIYGYKYLDMYLLTLACEYERYTSSSYVYARMRIPRIPRIPRTRISDAGATCMDKYATGQVLFMTELPAESRTSKDYK